MVDPDEEPDVKEVTSGDVSEEPLDQETEKVSAEKKIKTEKVSAEKEIKTEKVSAASKSRLKPTAKALPSASSSSGAAPAKRPVEESSSSSSDDEALELLQDSPRFHGSRMCLISFWRV